MHIPVLQKELLTFLNPQSNENFIDATVDGGGDALAILKRTSPQGKVLGIDWTPELIQNLRERIKGSDFEKRLILVCDNFASLKKIVKDNHFTNISGVIIDLGLSSWHLESLKRGFSFQRNESLDMRYSLSNQLTAAKIVNEWPPQKLEEIFENYGGEKSARRLAKEISKARKIKPIVKTQDLVALIERLIPKTRRRHPATKVFQALRIATNQELENLQKVLPQALQVLKPKGKLAVISFHSLEDRLVKKFFQEAQISKRGIILTKTPIIPSLEERHHNPRSRSAKLRIFQKI